MKEDPYDTPFQRGIDAFLLLLALLLFALVALRG